MADSQRVNITVPKPMYEEWKEAVDDKAVASSISELVRNSVNRNLDGNLGASVSPESVTAGPSDEMMGLLEGMDSTLERVESGIERVESESRTTNLPEGVAWQDLALQVIPKPEISDGREPAATVPETGISSEELADTLHCSEEAASSLLERLARQEGLRSATGGPDTTTYYWRDM